MEDIKLIYIDKGVLDYYKRRVKDNRETDLITAKKKLTRNWIMGNYISTWGNLEWRNYGCLQMCVDVTKNRMVYIENFKDLTSDVDMNRRSELNKLLGLED